MGEEEGVGEVEGVGKPGGVYIYFEAGESEDAYKHRNASSLHVNDIAYLSLIASIVHVKHSECHVGRSSNLGSPPLRRGLIVCHHVHGPATQPSAAYIDYRNAGVESNGRLCSLARSLVKS